MLQDILEALRGILSIFRKRKPLSHFDTGIGTDFKVLAPSAPFKLLEVRFHVGVLAAAETFSLTRVRMFPEAGPMLNYIDHLILSQDLGTTGILDLTAAFGGEEAMFSENDTIQPALSANTGADRWGLEIVYELL